MRRGWLTALEVGIWAVYLVYVFVVCWQAWAPATWTFDPLALGWLLLEAAIALVLASAAFVARR